MSVVVRIPTPLRRMTNGKDKVEVESYKNIIYYRIPLSYKYQVARPIFKQKDARKFFTGTPSLRDQVLTSFGKHCIKIE